MIHSVNESILGKLDIAECQCWGVDILPTELSCESSEHFGNALGDVIKNLVEAIMDTTPKSDRMEMRSMTISLRGQLCYLGLISQITDAVEANGCSLTFHECTFLTGQFYHKKQVVSGAGYFRFI